MPDFVTHAYAPMTSKPLTCLELDELIQDEADGALSPEMQTAFEAHLAACPACRRHVAGYKATLSLMKAALKDEPPMPSPHNALGDRRPRDRT